MAMAAKLLLLFLFPFAFSIASPSSDLISSLPGQPPVSFLQFSGYIPVDSASGLSFFYYFVEAQTDAASKPLTLWLNGGPGCTSIGNGAFTENGPFRVSRESGELIEDEFAWNRESNMLYWDFPAGVGWSYSNTSSDYIADDASTAMQNFQFLQNWLEAFPEYKGRELFITGESYAGHYAFQLAALLVDYISEQGGETVFNFLGMAIGNPLLNGLIDFPETVFFQWTHGLISDAAYSAVISNCNFSIFAVLTEACAAASAELDREVTDFTDPYDVLIDVCLAPSTQQARRLKRSLKNPIRTVSSTPDGPLDVCIDDEVVAYMNLPSVQEAFHANTTGLPYSWYYCSEGSLIYDYSSEDDSMLSVLAHVLEAGVPILVYSGDEDTVIPFGGTRRQIHQLAKIMNLTTTVPYSAWFDGGQVGGWTQVYGPLSYATVRGAAHMVPYTSPSRALTLFASFLAGDPLPLDSPSLRLRRSRDSHRASYQSI